MINQVSVNLYAFIDKIYLINLMFARFLSCISFPLQGLGLECFDSCEHHEMRVSGKLFWYFISGIMHAILVFYFLYIILQGTCSKKYLDMAVLSKQEKNDNKDHQMPSWK